MSITRLLLRAVLGRRLPTHVGEIAVDGVSAPVTIRRDRWGVPHVDAASDADAAFAVGFCHGQDRSAQLETLWRVGRGRLAEWVGPAGLPADQMSRRIGFRRSAELQVAAQAPDILAQLDAYARGVNGGRTVGLPRAPHEFAILGGGPSTWDAADVLAFLKLQSFLLPSNWDVELARLRMLLADGPDAVRALDPLYPQGHAITAGEWREAGGRQFEAQLAHLAEGLAAISAVLPRGGGSNNWAIGGGRTTTGFPLLASDPHLAPTAPAPWYLAHVRTPEWEAAGAGMVGAPGFAIGHNGHAAWGVTAGLTDNTDLFIETLGPDRASVREADGRYTPCRKAREVIAVKGRAEVVEEVLVTPRGPVVSPLFAEVEGLGPARVLSLRAVWLDPLPLVGFLGAVRARSFDAFRRCFVDWPVLPLNVLYADRGGAVGWQLVGQAPRRKGGAGLVPRAADAADAGWDDALVPFEEMPHQAVPPDGVVATANNAPLAADEAPFLGLDFIDGYRCAAIRSELQKRPRWDREACSALQTNVRSLPWEEVRAVVLSLTPDEPAAREALAILRNWDGRVSADSPGAAVFELFVADLCVRVARCKAPRSWKAALGDVGLGGAGHNLFADRRVAHLVRLLHDQPAGWFARPWPDEMAVVLGGVWKRLRSEVGPSPAFWGWGHLRQLRLEHLLFGKHWLLGRAFNLGPVPCGGDQNTISQAGARPLHPTDFTHNMANMRTVFDLADPSQSTFVLCGGQSGNPCSPHYTDQFPLWREGEAITLPWSQAAVAKEATAVLRLTSI